MLANSKPVGVNESRFRTCYTKAKAFGLSTSQKTNRQRKFYRIAGNEPPRLDGGRNVGWAPLDEVKKEGNRSSKDLVTTVGKNHGKDPPSTAPSTRC